MSQLSKTHSLLDVNSIEPAGLVWPHRPAIFLLIVNRMSMSATWQGREPCFTAKWTECILCRKCDVLRYRESFVDARRQTSVHAEIRTHAIEHHRNVLNAIRDPEQAPLGHARTPASDRGRPRHVRSTTASTIVSIRSSVMTMSAACFAAGVLCAPSAMPTSASLIAGAS